MYHDDLSSGREFSLDESALELMPVPILIHDHKTVLFANRLTLDVLGARNADEIVGKPVSGIIHRDGAEAGATRRELVLTQGHTVRDVPIKVVGVDGVVRHMIANGIPIVQGNGERAVLVTATVVRVAADSPEPTLPE